MQDSVPKCLNCRAIIPCTGTVVKSCPDGIKQLPSSNELDAQHVPPHQTTIKRKDHHTWKSCACLISLSWFDATVLQSSCKKRRFQNVRNGFTWKSRSLGSLGHPEQQEISKWLTNRKASCCNLLKWITKLKCVNSEVRTVITHPKKGCLKWLHGTMSEPPWKSH